MSEWGRAGGVGGAALRTSLPFHFVVYIYFFLSYICDCCFALVFFFVPGATNASHSFVSPAIYLPL